jgi:multidrug resistance protein
MRGGEGRRLPEGFGTIWGAVALDLVGFGIVLPILPLYAERFDASPIVVGLLVASFSMAQFVFAPIWGRVSDRIGRKPVLVASLVGTAVGSLLTGLAGSLWVLFFARVLDGVSGASVSVAQAAVTDLAPPSERPRLLGLLGAAFGIGFVAGPAIGGLAALGGPHVPFLVAAALAGVNAVVAAVRLPETRSVNASSGPAARTAHRTQGLGAYLVVAFVSLCAFSAFEATFALFGERRLGLRIASTGAVFAVIGVLIAVVNGGLVAPTVRRLGEAGTLRLGLLLNAGGLAILPFVHSWAALAPAVVLLTVGQGLVTPTLSATVAGIVDEDRRGEALGAQQSAGGLARVVGPVLGGVAFQQVGVGAPYVAGVALLLVAVLLLTSSGRRRRRRDRQATVPRPRPAAPTPSAR